MNGLTRLTEFLDVLEKARIPYALGHFRCGSVMVSFAVVGERYEIDFFEDREEISVFKGDESVTIDLAPVLKVISDFV